MGREVRRVPANWEHPNEMKIQLFYPKSVIGCGPHNGIYWPLTLLTIGSHIKHHKPNTDIEIWDGELYSNNEQLIEKLDPNAKICGISCTSFNYSNALKIAKEAKGKGLEVIFGGLHATYFGETILRNKPYVDYVIYGKGEGALLKFLTNDKQNVPNLIWKNKKEIIRNPPEEGLSLDDLTSLDYSLLELRKYSRNHRRVYPSFPNKPLSVMTHEGCVKREMFGPCSFCSIKERLYFRDTGKFWKSVLEAVSKYDFNIAKDWGDSLTGDKDYLRKIVETRPKNLEGLTFSVYSNLSDIDQETISLLKRLNVGMLFAAVESANDEILRRMNKRTTNMKMREAVKLIAKNNIPIYTSYVLGERGETIETLEETLNFAKDIRETADVRVSNGSPMVPLPGSPNFARLTQKFPELRNQDSIDLIHLKKLWAEYFCPDLPSYEILEEYAQEIGELGDIPNRFGWDLKEK
jgi:radical SAM superfamily enzyme YgiQ (UPF0313 family)